eukprot:6447616-Pyramimonas_sp.AAC.1
MKRSAGLFIHVDAVRFQFPLECSAQERDVGAGGGGAAPHACGGDSAGRSHLQRAGSRTSVFTAMGE